jgi:16S rRNA G966 N2-methylase RsmD
LPRTREEGVQRGTRFDILFADPPYDEGLARKTLQWLGKGDVLTENGIVVLQHSVREKLEGSQAQVLVIADQRRYGDTMLSFLIRGQISNLSPKHEKIKQRKGS